MRRSRWIPWIVFAAAVPFSGERVRGRDPSPSHPILLAGSSHAVIGAGYRQRMRLGMGSPFRLIDFALHDPRLDPAARAVVARRILDGTLRGDGYRIDPLALTPVVNPSAGRWARSGDYHLELIEDAVAVDDDPRTGELTVRLAYQLAVMEGTIEARGYLRVAHAAALLRDREVARRDAHRLVDEASRRGADPVTLVPGWRRALRFEVERPALQPLPPAEVRRAVARAPRLLARVRRSGMSFAGRTTVPPLPVRLLAGGTAATLARTAERTAMPPQTAVAVRVRFADRSVKPAAGRQKRAWAAFAAAATGEEQLVAQRTLLLARAPEFRPIAAGILLDAAVDLRTFAQERPWFPGFGGPSRGELMERHGVWVVLDGDVPSAWGPHYRAVVDGAASRLRQVLPEVSLRGLTVRVSREPGTRWALARHNPRKRIIHWPALTGPGTLAHEIAHDLDRQAAVRLYGVRGTYATTRAARLGDRPLAPALERIGEPSRGILRAVHPRGGAPNEVFARNVDWLVATALAARGLSDGYLSSTQDEVLTGHGTARPPGPPGSYDDALRTVLEAIIPSARPGRLAMRGRQPPPESVLRLVLGPAVPGRPERAPFAASDMVAERARAFATLSRWKCDGARAAPDRELATAYRRLVAMGAAARARRNAVREAGEAGGVRLRREVLRALYPPRPLFPGLGPRPRPRVRDLLAGVRVLEAHRVQPEDGGCASTPLFGPDAGACIELLACPDTTLLLNRTVPVFRLHRQLIPFPRNS